MPACCTLHGAGEPSSAKKRLRGRVHACIMRLQCVRARDDVFLDVRRGVVYDTRGNRIAMEKDQEFYDALRDYAQRHAGEKVGKITLAMLRKAMRELDLPASNTAEGAKQLAAKTAKALSKGFDDYRKASASMDALMEKQYLNEAEKQRQKQDAIMGKLHKLQFIHDALQRIVAKQSTEVYWDGKAFAMFSMSPCEYVDGFKGYSGGFSYYPAQALDLEAFKKLLPKQAEDKQFSVLLSESGLRFYMSHGAEWETVEGRPGGILSGGGYESGKYCKIKLGKKASDKRAALFGIAKDVSITPETCKLFMALCSGLNDTNLQSGGVCIWNRERESVRRDVIIDLGELARAISPNGDRRAVSRVKKKLQEAKDYLQTLKTGIVTTDCAGNEYSGALNVFETIGERVEGKNRILARFTQTFIDEVLRGSRKGKPMYAQMMGDCAYSLSGFNISLYLFEALSYQNTPPGEWRQIKLTDALSWLGYTPNRRIHNSLYDDVLRPLNEYIQETEEKGLASHSIVRRGEDGRMLELTEADKRFLEGREPCNTYHSWKDLDSYVLMCQLHGLKKKLEAVGLKQGPRMEAKG